MTVDTKLTFLVTLLATAVGCSSLIPEPSENEINAQAAKAYAEVKAKAKISRNAEWNELVQRVSRRIAASSGENFNWEYILIDSPEVNAWCMPGGKIAVYTGIMPVLKTEGALAAVLGHEVAHATLRHGKERYARAIKGNLAGAVIGGAAAIGGQAFCKTNTCRQTMALGGAAAGLAITFFDRKFGREDESASDKAGQIYMAKAGYDPAEAIEVWKRMGAANQGKTPPEFLSTHPSDVRRRDQLTQWLPEARSYYDRAPQKFGIGQNL
jgi:metalloendopeptidase OMA1, mitochondrial